MKLYIANRGEIAVRIMKTAKSLGIPCYVGYARVDQDLPFVRLATKAVCLAETEARSAYLDISKIISAAKELGATHIHPGYGFLSERGEFVDAVEAAGLVFVGPTSETMRLLGDKIGSRRFLKDLGVGLLPAYDGDDQSDERFLKEADNIGFPLLIKPSAGGGGKGMTVVRRKEDLLPAIESARRVALSSFKDDRLFFERYLERARHIEVQIIGDGRGDILTLGERECSLQRRHQKLIEETPCAFLPPELRQKIYRWSQMIGEKVKYRSAGTIEWIWDGDKEIYFLEVNARLQVEHPVTESVWKLDLVEEQLRVAEGGSLTNKPLQSMGHAMELRICAEDPAQDFMPSGGKIFRLDLPEEARCDFGYASGNIVPGDFDSMLGKIIVWGVDRADCLSKAEAALESLVLFGPTTNRAYLLQVLRDARVQKGDLFTELLKDIPFQFDAGRAILELQRRAADESAIETDGEDLDYYSPWGRLAFENREAFWEDYQGRRFYFLPFADWTTRLEKKQLSVAGGEESQDFQNAIRSPMPGKIIQVKVQDGQTVEKGETLLILEAMKMEHQMRALKKSKVKKVHIASGQQVLPDDLLVELEAE